jgi:hypothetical protein
MGDVRIDEVHTELEITEGVGALSPSEVKKLVALVMEQLKAHREHDEMRRRDDVMHERAYTPGSGH